MSLLFFGEMMLRLTPSIAQQQLVCAEQLSVDFAGAESNVASSLALMGHECQFVTKLPSNALGDHGIASLKKYGIQTDYIRRGGQRIGSYFIEMGMSIRPSKVVYDRAYSAFSQISNDEFDWPSILSGKRWLHVSGISPALSTQCAVETIKAVKIAKSLGVKVSFDLNYRRSLWDDSQKARDYFSEILTYSNLAFGNAGVISDVFDYQTPDISENELAHVISQHSLEHLGKTSQRSWYQANDLAEFLRAKFDVDFAMTERVHHSANQNTLTGFYITSTTCSFSAPITVEIKDRLGTGDAFAAAVLHGLERGWHGQQIAQFANAAFALAHTGIGDQNWSNEAEIQYIADGNLSGHIIR